MFMRKVRNVDDVIVLLGELLDDELVEIVQRLDDHALEVIAPVARREDDFRCQRAREREVRHENELPA